MGNSVESRFERYADVMVEALGHADRATPARWYLRGLMLPREEPPVPRSVLLLDPILLILILGGSRIGYRVWKERRLRNVLGSRGRPVIILGAGDAAADLLKKLARMYLAVNRL